MKALEDTDLMPFGKHRGCPMSDVPASYLHCATEKSTTSSVPSPITSAATSPSSKPSTQMVFGDMKCILKIGHLAILLPSISGVESIMKTLSKGVLVYDMLYKKQVQIREEIEVGMVIVPSETKFVDETESEVFPEETAKEKRIAARLMRGGPLPRLRLKAPSS